jgi:dihydropteroate synthase
MITRQTFSTPPPGSADAGARFAELLGRWRAGGRASQAIVMGIVNVTPDSFSDAGQFFDHEVAIAHGKRLAREGAEILDVGGVSTRGGADPVSEAEELRRVIPVIEALRTAVPAISIDTMKAAVADKALRAGAAIINDVRGLQGDPELVHVAAQTGAGVIAMHNPGLLGSSQALPGDPVEACLNFLARSVDIASAAGVKPDRIAIDPGFGFGKSVEQNLELIARLPELLALGVPVLVGTSRKSFIGKVTGRELSDRVIGTVVTNVAAALAGAAIVRVHDVAEHVEAMRMTAAIRDAGRAPAGDAG